MIKAIKLGKKYQISSFSKEEFWALRDLNIKIEEGEQVGLVGSNGSGKSTLLKLFSRITRPSEGRVELLGRVGALLEVGTGFHLELTGKENIYLSGAILGMGRREVKKHFDEIVSFSEVEPFLDLPVKKYSSGMFLRLAFSILAHLKSEILILDEILAIGDLPFQQKCFKKIQSLVCEGRTFCLTSHELHPIRTLCSRVLWIENGKCIADGDVETILSSYESKAVLQSLHSLEN